MQNSNNQQGFSLGGANNSFGLFSLGSGFFTNSFVQEHFPAPSTPISSDSTSSAATAPAPAPAATTPSTATTSTVTTTPSANSSNNATPQLQSQSQVQSQIQVQSSTPLKEAPLHQFMPLHPQQANEANKSTPAPIPLSVPIPVRPTAFNFAQSKEVQMNPSMVVPPTNSTVIVDNLMKNTKLPDESQEELIEQPHGHDGKMFIDVTPYLVLSQSDAAKVIGIPSSTLSKRWKEATLNRKWPFRTVQKLDREILTLIRNLESYKCQGKDNYVSAAAENALIRLLRVRKEELRSVYIRIN